MVLFELLPHPNPSLVYQLTQLIQVRAKIFVPNKKGDIGMEVYYLCQPNTYVIACEFGEQQ